MPAHTSSGGGRVRLTLQYTAGSEIGSVSRGYPTGPLAAASGHRIANDGAGHAVPPAPPTTKLSASDRDHLDALLA